MSTDVQDIFPLSAAQRLWLLHALRAGSANAGVTQSRTVLRGKLDPIAFRRAWDSVVDRHPAMRTSIHWSGLDRPVQVVRRAARLDIEEQDWSDLEAAVLEAEVARLLDRDKQQGFDLGRSPLMRLHLIRTGSEEHRLVWSLHHILFDGWSAQLVLGEAMGNYEALCSGEQPNGSPAHSFHEYVSWERRQDLSAAEDYWRRQLQGARASAVARPTEGVGVLDGTTRVAFPEPQWQSLRDMCRRHRVTLSTAIQGALAAAVATWMESPEAIFGLTVSGRDLDIPGATETVGLFTNTIPRRVRLSPQQTVGAWLQEIQDDFVEGSPFHYCPAQWIDTWSGSDGQRLFDIVLVVENQPAIALQGRRGEASLQLTELDGDIVSGAPINLVVLAEPQPELRCRFDRRNLDQEAVDWLCRGVRNMLLRMGEETCRTVGDLVQPVTPRPPAPPSIVERPSREGRLRGHQSREVETPLDRVASIWCEILDVERVEAQDNFFEQGGTSLSAARLIERLEAELGLSVDLSDLVFQSFAQVCAGHRTLQSPRRSGS